MDQRSNMVNREADTTGVVRDVHVVNKVRRKSSRPYLPTISSLLGNGEMTLATISEAFLQA